MTADTAYDALAPHYQEQCRARAAYLAAVDRIVVGGIPAGARSLLDVGAGDGHRAVRIARAARIPRVVLAEPSAAMADECARRGAAEVWRTTAQELPEDGEPFDVVTCLWNVLGHVPTGAERVEALRRMRALLAAGGVLFLDVNHRYNASAYGVLPTLARMAHDAVRPSERNGDVSVAWRVGDVTIRAAGHVFRRAEMAHLLHVAGWRVRALHVVDYRTGAIRRSAYAGQLLYELAPG